MNTTAKTIFAVLVLANVGLALWASGFRPAEAPPEGPRPALHAEKMPLLQETGARASTVKHACYRLGPFAEAAAAETATATSLSRGPRPDPLADKAAAFLRTVPLAYERKTEEQTAVGGYRVYLPPLASREAAEKKRQELNRLGFRDHSVMQEEGMQNAISLGLFTVEENARNHMQALAAKGVKADMQTLSQPRTLSWFYLGPTENLSAALPRLREIDWGGETKLEEIGCPAGR